MGTTRRSRPRAQPTDALLKASPSSVSLRYDEPVETVFGALRVYDERGRRSIHGTVRHLRGSTIAVGIGHALTRGSYTVAWRVVSADTHPVHGAFVFSVGARAAGGQAAAARIEAGQAPARSVGVGFGAVRFLAFALVLLITGGAIAIAVVFPRHRQRRLERVLGVACLALLPVTVAGLVYEAATAGGFGLREASDPRVLRALLGTTFGTVWALRAGIAVLLAAILLAGRRLGGENPGMAQGVHRPGRHRARRLDDRSVACPGGGRLAMLADGTHVLAAAIWTGGLVSLALVLRQAPADDRWRLATRIVPRFSTLAIGAVGLLVLAGIAGAYVEVGAWHGLWDTTYGQLVLAKSAVLIPLLGLGAFNNRVAVPRLRKGIESHRIRQHFARNRGGRAPA